MNTFIVYWHPEPKSFNSAMSGSFRYGGSASLLY